MCSFCGKLAGEMESSAVLGAFESNHPQITPTLLKLFENHYQIAPRKNHPENLGSNHPKKSPIFENHPEHLSKPSRKPFHSRHEEAWQSEPCHWPWWEPRGSRHGSWSWKGRGVEGDRKAEVGWRWGKQPGF